MATLEVVGPDDRDEVRPLSDYCALYRSKMSAALDMLEVLGRRDSD
jgi:hypothetical protein